MLPQVALMETPGKRRNTSNAVKSCQHIRISESQCRGPLATHLDRFGHLTERVFAHRAVVADSLDVQETSLAWKPIARREGRFFSRLPMPKSRVSLIVVSVRRAHPSLWSNALVPGNIGEEKRYMGCLRRCRFTRVAKKKLRHLHHDL